MDLDPSPPSPPSSPYAHVFLEGEPEAPWPKLHAKHYLSELHAKCWGKDIREEMHQWQEKHSTDQPMDTDQNDGLLANFALYFGIDSQKSTMWVWVRKDYALLYDHCTTYFNGSKIEPFGDGPPSIVIIGQPGIGK